MIYVRSRRASKEKLEVEFPDALILDVTSKGEKALKQFSPFYPHGGVPVPNSAGVFAASVEGLWQGLKVFENSGVDMDTLSNTTMKDIKRTVRRFGTPLGHRYGIDSNRLLNYQEARLLIYLPAYRWVLENKVGELVSRLRTKSETHDLVLLDYNTNCNVRDLSKPLSHAYLLGCFIAGNYPDSRVSVTEELVMAPKAISKRNSTKEQVPKTHKKPKKTPTTTGKGRTKRGTDQLGLDF